MSEHITADRADGFLRDMRQFLLGTDRAAYGDNGTSPLATMTDNIVPMPVVMYVCETAEALHDRQGTEVSKRYTDQMDELRMRVSAYVGGLSTNKDKSLLALTLKLVLETSQVKGTLDDVLEYAASQRSAFVELSERILTLELKNHKEAGLSELDLRIAKKLDSILPPKGPKLRAKKSVLSRCLDEIGRRETREGLMPFTAANNRGPVRVIRDSRVPGSGETGHKRTAKKG